MWQSFWVKQEDWTQWPYCSSLPFSGRFARWRFKTLVWEMTRVTLKCKLAICIFLDWKVSSGPRTWQMYWGDLEMNWAIMEIYCRLNVHHICASWTLDMMRCLIFDPISFTRKGRLCAGHGGKLRRHPEATPPKKIMRLSRERIQTNRHCHLCLRRFLQASMVDFEGWTTHRFLYRRVYTPQKPFAAISCFSNCPCSLVIPGRLSLKRNQHAIAELV